jgi:hypothetical protein
MNCGKKVIELREVVVREIETDEVRCAWFRAFVPAVSHDFGNGTILAFRAVAGEFFSAACRVIMGI